MIFILFKDVIKKEKKKDIEYNPVIFDEMVPVFVFVLFLFLGIPSTSIPCILTVKFRFMIGLSTKSINSSKRDLLKRGEEMKKT